MLIRGADISSIIDSQPCAEDDEAGGEWNEVSGIEQIKHAACEREHRKGADAAGPPPRRLREKSSKASPRKKLKPSNSAMLTGEDTVFIKGSRAEQEIE